MADEKVTRKRSLKEDSSNVSLGPRPATRKRSRSSENISGHTSSEASNHSRRSSGQCSNMQYRIERWSCDVPTKERLTSNHALCIYKTADRTGSKLNLPFFVRLGSKKSNAFYSVLDFAYDTISEKIKLQLNDDQKKYLKCFEECAEKMFGGLKFDGVENTWRDPKPNHNKRLQDCVSICKEKYEFPPYHYLANLPFMLSKVYTGYTSGFNNSYARNAMTSLCEICGKVLGITGTNDGYSISVENVGGSDPRNQGSCRVAEFYVEQVPNLKDVEELHKIFNVKEVLQSDCHSYIPDFVVRTAYSLSENDNYILYGKCKSTDRNKLLNRLWHLTLGGLFNSEKVYECGAEASRFKFIITTKANQGKNAVIKSDVQIFDFGSRIDFNTKVFCKAFWCLLQITKEKLY